MTEEHECRMPEPTEQHRRLMEAVGTWDVTCRYFMGGPDAPPTESRATEEVEAVGRFWLMGRFRGEVLGAPFEGRSLLGYDPWKERYVSTWADSLGPAYFHLEGRREGDLIVCEGVAPNPSDGSPGRYRTVEEWPEPDRRVSRMFLLTPDGAEVRLFEMVATRRR